eukprot:1545361-Rhodomonas_salina.2
MILSDQGVSNSTSDNANQRIDPNPKPERPHSHMLNPKSVNHRVSRVLNCSQADMKLARRAG